MQSDIMDRVASGMLASVSAARDIFANPSFEKSRRIKTTFTSHSGSSGQLASCRWYVRCSILS